MARTLFSSDLVTFTISGYLPGEYVLRVFPLICKDAESRKLSLSLLGPKSRMGHFGTGDDDDDRDHCSFFDWFEGPTYGVYSIPRDFLQLVSLGHAFNSLVLDGRGLGDMVEAAEKLFTGTDRLHLNIPSGRVINSFPFQLFPKLTKLEFSGSVSELILTGLWGVSTLTSLTVDRFSRRENVSKYLTPPAFAQTLRQLLTNSAQPLLDILAPYCQHLQEVASAQFHHDLMMNNPGVTSLILHSPRDTDLSPCTGLVKLQFTSYLGNLSTSNKLFNLVDISLRGVDIDPSAEFLAQCPALQHATLGQTRWEDIVELVSVLDPNKCTQLTIILCVYSQLPSFSEVNEVLLSRNFRVNVEFLLSLPDAEQHWASILELRPEARHVQHISSSTHNFLNLSYLPFFPSLAVLSLRGPLNAEQLSFIVNSCPTLREFRLKSMSEISSVLTLQSQSLCKLVLSFAKGPSDFNLKLPNLTHLTLNKGGGDFLRNLLNGDPLLELPLLRVLSLTNFTTTAPIPCEVGHESLTNLSIDFSRGYEVWHRAKITFTNLPRLKRVRVECEMSVKLWFDVPSDCDIYLKHHYDKDKWSREGNYQSEENYIAVLKYDGEKWIEEIDDSDD